MADTDGPAPHPHQPPHEPQSVRDGPGSRSSKWFTGVGSVCDTATRMSGTDGAAAAVFAPSQSRELVYATDSVAQQIDDLQFTLGEGPCLDAYRMSAPQLCPRLDSAVQLNRWPAFCIEAADVGVRAVFAFPVVGPQRVLGVLELYRRTVGQLKPHEYEAASVCATAIGETLLANWDVEFSMALNAAAAIDAATEGVVTHRGGGTYSRAGVYIASGMVAVQLRISADDGLDRLRAYAFTRGLSINAVAADIVARRLTLRDADDRS